MSISLFHCYFYKCFKIRMRYWNTRTKILTLFQDFTWNLSLFKLILNCSDPIIILIWLPYFYLYEKIKRHINIAYFIGWTVVYMRCWNSTKYFKGVKKTFFHQILLQRASSDEIFWLQQQIDNILSSSISFQYYSTRNTAFSKLKKMVHA